MTWQNRQALNWLLADKGGVCVMFGDQCCTFIPNNTAPGGKFREAMIKIKSLKAEVAENAGRDEKVWDWLDLKFGALGAWFVKLGIFLGVVVTIAGLLFCCILPILRSLVVQATTKHMEMLKTQDNGKILLEGNQSIYYQDWPDTPDASCNNNNIDENKTQICHKNSIIMRTLYKPDSKKVGTLYKL